MAGYPNLSTDTVIYSPKDLYLDGNVTVRLLDGTVLNIWGPVYVNGVLVSGGGGGGTVSDVMHVGPSAPTDPNIEIWWDSDETSSTGYIDVRQFGAVGDGVVDDTLAIQAAIDAASATGGGVVILPKNGPWKTTDTLVLKQYVRLEGRAGQWAKIQCSNAAANGITIASTGAGGWAIKNIEIAGTFDTGVSCAPVPIAVLNGCRCEMNQVKVSGTGTNGFRFANTYYSTFSNLSCEFATISNACFQILATVNGVVFNNLVTGGTQDHLYCVYIHNTEQPPGGSDLSAGRVLTFNGLVLQGGKYGLYMAAATSVVVNEPYFENVANDVVMGSPGASVTVQGVVFNGGYYAAVAAGNPYYANRGPAFNIRNSRSCTFNSPLMAPANYYNLTITGGGGAAATGYMLVDRTGVPVAYVAGSPGRAYSTTPTVTAPAVTSGVADTLVAVMSAQRVVGYTVTPGSSPLYTAALAFPVSVLYGEGTSKITFNTPSTVGPTDFHPFHMMIGRDSTAATNNGVNVYGDAGQERHTLTMVKTEGAAHLHAISYQDNATGAFLYFLRTIPLIAAP